VQVLLLHRQLCDASGCLPEIDGEFVYRDADHLRRNLSDNVLAEYTRSAGPDLLL